MPAVTYLSDWEERNWTSIPDDKDANDLLQELRKVSGENWLVGRHNVPSRHASIWKRLFLSAPAPRTIWTLYADCHGEWQVMSLCAPGGSSLFHGSNQSREDVMNYILGYIGGYTRRDRSPSAPSLPMVNKHE